MEKSVDIVGNSTVEIVLLLAILVMAAVYFRRKTGQTLKDNELIGSWLTQYVLIDSWDFEIKDKLILKEVERSFKQVQMELREDGRFFIRFPEEGLPFTDDLTRLNGKSWRYFERERVIRIGDEGSRYSDMRIPVRKINDQFYFRLPLVKLQMKKQTNAQPKPKKKPSALTVY